MPALISSGTAARSCGQGQADGNLKSNDGKTNGPRGGAMRRAATLGRLTMQCHIHLGKQRDELCNARCAWRQRATATCARCSAHAVAMSLYVASCIADLASTWAAHAGRSALMRAIHVDVCHMVRGATGLPDMVSDGPYCMHHACLLTHCTCILSSHWWVLAAYCCRRGQVKYSRAFNPGRPKHKRRTRSIAQAYGLELSHPV